MIETKFDDIRPYYDHEIPEAMKRIADNKLFPLLASYVYPGENVDKIRSLLKTFKTIADFQLIVMKSVSEQIIAKSISGFTYEGVDQLKKEECSLFVSNHRDIMLDSCLLQYILYQNGYDTTEITFGANLMSTDLIIDIGKANKMFRSERGGNMKDFYKSAMHMSEYLRYVITEKRQSVWIAQRNGRTKDGNDTTDQGIIKMFCMSNQKDKIKALEELNIVPVSISYEWEPCDILKALELYESRNIKYIKKPGEDLNSIITGIIQSKGHVHIALCPKITHEDLMQYYNCTNNEYHKNIATLIDNRIYEHYRLNPNNFIAHDLRYGLERYSNKYTIEQKEQFINYMKGFSKFGIEIEDNDLLKDIFLGIYANPINNINPKR